MKYLYSTLTRVIFGMTGGACCGFSGFLWRTNFDAGLWLVLFLIGLSFFVLSWAEKR